MSQEEGGGKVLFSQNTIIHDCNFTSTPSQDQLTPYIEEKNKHNRQHSLYHEISCAVSEQSHWPSAPVRCRQHTAHDGAVIRKEKYTAPV